MMTLADEPQTQGFHGTRLQGSRGTSHPGWRPKSTAQPAQTSIPSLQRPGAARGPSALLSQYVCHLAVQALCSCTLRSDLGCQAAMQYPNMHLLPCSCKDSNAQLSQAVLQCPNMRSLLNLVVFVRGDAVRELARH